MLFLVACTASNITTERQNYTMEGEDRIEGSSADGIGFLATVTIIFQIEEANLELAQRNFPAGDYLELRVKPVLRTEVSSIAAENQALDLYGSTLSAASLAARARIESELTDNVRTILAEDGITVSSVYFRGIQFDEDIPATIEAIQTATDSP